MWNIVIQTLYIPIEFLLLRAERVCRQIISVLEALIEPRNLRSYLSLKVPYLWSDKLRLLLGFRNMKACHLLLMYSPQNNRSILVSLRYISNVLLNSRMATDVVQIPKIKQNIM